MARLLSVVSRLLLLLVWIHIQQLSPFLLNMRAVRVHQLWHMPLTIQRAKRGISRFSLTGRLNLSPMLK